MRQTRPLPDTHPEFTIHHYQGFTEYRVAHWRLARDGSGRVIRGTYVWSWVDAIVLLVAAVVLLAQFNVPVSPLPIPAFRLISSPILVVGAGIVLIWLVWVRCTQVLHESLLVFPTLGIQLETHLGHPHFVPIFTTHHFIPLSALEDVVIHEGFRRWNVRYYLAALYRTRTGTRFRTAAGMGVASPSSSARASGGESGRVEVRVAFENVLPYFPVLKMIYLDVQQTLFPPLTRIVERQTDG